MKKFTARVAARVAQEGLGSGAGLSAPGQTSPAYSASSFSATQGNGAGMDMRGPLAGLLPDLFLPPTITEIMTDGGGQGLPPPPLE